MNNSSICTLFITKEVPYPPIGGPSLRNWQNINIMMKFGRVGIFSASNWSPKNTFIPGVDLWKHSNVTTQRSSWEKLNNRLWWLNSHRHSDADWAYSKTAARELDEILTTFRPDIVVFEEVWLYPYLSVVKNHKCKIILDNHNVESSLAEQKNRSVQGFKSQLKAKIQQKHLLSMERDFCKHVNQTWLCSKNDVVLTSQLYGNVAPAYVIPNSINVAHYDCVRSGECSPVPALEGTHRNIIFLGQMSYKPNTIAAELLIKEIYPRIKQLYPDSRLAVVGRNPTPAILEAAKLEPGIIVTGGVPDVRPYLAAASVMVVPLLQGGGTRLKIIEAFASGCPVVSTAKGAEGLNVQDGEHLLIRNEVEELVEGVCQLWSEPSLGNKLAQSAYELLQTEYSWEAVGLRVEQAIREL